MTGVNIALEEEEEKKIFTVPDRGESLAATQVRRGAL